MGHTHTTPSGSNIYTPLMPNPIVKAYIGYIYHSKSTYIVITGVLASFPP